MSSVVTRPISLTERGTSLARLIMALGNSRGDMYRAELAASGWKDTPEVLATLQSWRAKAAVPSGSTSDATFAGPLSLHGIGQEAITLMRGMSVIGALEGRMRRTPLRVSIARETGTGITGGWVAPGNAIPVQKTAFDSVLQEHFKFAVIIPLSRELIELSNPSAEATIRTSILGGLASALDNQFLLASVAVSAGVNPASVTNGSTEITTTGTTAAAIAADLAAMLAAVTTPGPLTWVMKPKTMYRISLVLGSQAAGLPASLFGIPVIASVNSPAQISLLDPSAILYSDSGQFEIDVSDQALVQLDDAPANPTVAATVLESAFGKNHVYVRALRWVAWLRVDTAAAAFMTVTY
jgi:HK97 family phage major capsid protein